MYFFIALLIDQLIKFAVVATNCKVNFIPNILNLMYVKNTGGVYGILENNNFTFSIVSFLIISTLIIYYFKDVKKNYSRVHQIIWQFIIAGGVGNLIDRVFRGFVVDYVQMIFFGVFNLADAFIVVGIILILIMEVREIVSGNNRKDSD